MSKSTSATASGTPPATARRVGLDRADVVDAALALVEAEGAGALTMRRLAAELDVTTTTIYWHVGSRDELVLALVGRLSEKLAERAVVGSSGEERILAAATNIWDSARAHRHVTALAYEVGAASVLELPLEIALVRELEAAGLRGVAARDALRAIVMCTAGFLVVAMGSRRSGGQQETGSRVPSARDLWDHADTDGISAETVAALGRSPALPTLFETTMRSLVRGLLDHGGSTR